MRSNAYMIPLQYETHTHRDDARGGSVDSPQIFAVLPTKPLVIKMDRPIIKCAGQ